jgi:hypothetical protein
VNTTDKEDKDILKYIINYFKKLTDKLETEEYSDRFAKKKVSDNKKLDNVREEKPESKWL